MPVVARYAIAILIGSLAAAMLVAAIEVVGHRLHPPPPDLDPADREAFRAHVASLPRSALLMVGAAWTIGAGVGGWLAAAIAGARHFLFASLVGAMVLAGAVANLLLLPHPAWFGAVGIASIVAATALAAWLARRTPLGAPRRVGATDR